MKTRELPVTKNAVVPEGVKEPTRQEKQINFASQAIFAAARSSPEMREALNHVGHEMLSAFGSMRIIINQQAEEIELLHEKRLTEASDNLTRYSKYVLGEKFETRVGEDGKTYIVLPDAKLFGDVEPGVVSVDILKRIAAEWAGLVVAVESYREANGLDA